MAYKMFYKINKVHIYLTMKIIAFYHFYSSFKELVIKPSTTTSTTTTTRTTTVTTPTSTSTIPMTSSVSNKTLSSIRTTPNQIKSTTTQKGVIIDDGDSSKGDKDPGYNVLTTPAVYPISPAEQGNKLFLNQNSCFRATWLSLKPLYF